LERNVMGELNMYRQLGTKPNFSEIGRRYGLDRHTVARYWSEGEKVEDGRSDRASTFDALAEVIYEKASLPGVTMKAIHEYLLDRHPEAGLAGYNAFTHWCRGHGVRCGGVGAEPHPRFETPPGRQLQFDWKESLRMTDALGEVFEFNVFTATLGWSRMHRLVYSPTRTEDDLLACLLATIVRFGGVTEEAVTDDMSAVVTVRDGRRRRSERVSRFFREAGCELRLCAVRTPETKGKDESANRFVNRLRAYERDFVGEAGLVEAIARVEARCNAEPNGTTGVPPATLFMREKEHLRPVGNLRLLQEMVGDVTTQVVPPTMLVRAAGRQYSVPRSCIGRRATVVATPSGQVRVTVGGEEVAVHDAGSARGPIAYDGRHYAEALEGKRWFADEDIREAARANLELLESLGGGGAE